jgi:hypothetical protein
MHPVSDGQRAELEHAFRQQPYDGREMNHDREHEYRLSLYGFEERLAWHHDGRAGRDRFDACRARMPVDCRKFAENRTLPYLAKTYAPARRGIDIDPRMAADEKQHVEGLILVSDHQFSREEVLMMRELA